MLLKKIKDIYISLETIFPNEITLNEKIYAVEKQKYKAKKENDTEKISKLESLMQIINEYKNYCEQLTKEKTSSLEMNDEELQFIILHLNDLIDEKSRDIDIDSFIKIYEYCENKDLIELEGIDLFASLIVEAYVIKGYTWRGKKIAQKLKETIPSRIKKDNYIGYCNILNKLGTFYKVVRNVKESYNCLKLASDICLSMNNIEYSAIYLAQAYKYNIILPENLRQIINKDEIEKVYKEYSDIVFKYTEYSTLKVDPIEHTKQFQDVYDEVMEAVEREVQKQGDLHLSHQRWMIMANEFSKKGIHWKSPALMNPGYLFD